MPPAPHDRATRGDRSEGPSGRGGEETPEEVAERAERKLTDTERDHVADAQRLSARTVYAVIRREGEEELHRPPSSLWWSGVAAGVGISTSVLAEGVLHAELDGSPNLHLIENLGYTVGFVLVILSRLQLFTENTISVVLPVLAEPRAEKFLRTARLWSIVFCANMIGTFATALLAVHGQVAAPEYVEGMLAISRHYAELAGIPALARGVPAGFYIAAVVWMLPSAKGFEIFVMMLFTYLIAVSDFTHVVAGATEVFLLVVAGELALSDAAFGLILPTFLGNVIGGTGLFAILAYAQVHEEM